MLPVKFDRKRMEELVECLATGKPIAPTEAGAWKKSDLMLLAGVCWCVLGGQDPPMHPGVELSDLYPERQEAIRAQMHKDVFVGTDFCYNLAYRVCVGTYDDHFEPIVEAVISEKGGAAQIIPQEGFK